MNVILGLTGSVASTLAKKLVDALHEAGHEVIVVATNQSHYFFSQKTLGVKVYTEHDEWPHVSYEKDEEICHIKLRDWADVMVIAPLSANTLAKIASGLCDNLLTCIVRAWNRDKKFVVAPAMNTVMWDNPFTAEHLNKIRKVYSAQVVMPISKKLACGDDGIGAMAFIPDIITAIN